jgi:hypothetical protein
VWQQDFAKVIVDRRINVDDQDASIEGEVVSWAAI